MAAKVAASIPGRWMMRTVLLIAVTSLVLALTPKLHAQSLLDKAMDAPSSPAGGPDIAPNPVQRPAAIAAPVAYHPPSPPSSVSIPLAVTPPATTSSAHPAQTTAALAPKATSLKSDVKAVIHKLDPLHAFHEHRYQIAAAEFPAFCQDWGRKLQERTQWGISQIQWHADNGIESGTYTGYSPINSCTTKMSENGTAIGELTYEERVYSLSGKTVQEAKHAQPKQVSVMRTLEIFRFDHNKWFE